MRQFGVTSTCCRAISLSTTEVKPVRILELQPNDFIDMFINLPDWMHILPELSRSLWARAKRIVVPQSINWHAIRKTDFFSGRNTCFMTHWKDKRFAKQTRLDWMHILPELSRSLWARAKRIVVPQSINWHAIRKTDFFSGRNTCFMTHWKDKRFAKQTRLTHLKCSRYSSPQDLRLQGTCVATDSLRMRFSAFGEGKNSNPIKQYIELRLFRNREQSRSQSPRCFVQRNGQRGPLG